jgi:hypothetical protein
VTSAALGGPATASASTARPAALKAPAVLESRRAQFALLIGFALLIRFPAFGEWNFDIDDQFYAMVGQRMLAGDLLYVDIWDRKPPALYLTFAAIALISNSALAYQLAATLSAALGAFGIARLARPFAGTAAALMSGAAYLALLSRFGGASAQAPVWFNTLMIFAAWTIVSRLDLLRRGRIDAVLAAGMASAGLAIAFKQSAAIECAFFGVFVTAMLVLVRTPPARLCAQVALLALLGALPMAATFAYYAAIGHLPELWHSLVTSNFARIYADDIERTKRMAALLGLLGMPIVFAALGWMALPREVRSKTEARFFALWSGAALIAVASFPNVFYHYALPVLPPLLVLCAGFFARRDIGRLALAVIVIHSLFYAGAFNLGERWRAHRDTPEFVDYVRAETPGKRLLVWGIPNYLYMLVGANPPRPLAFPPHLYEGAEAGVSGTDEHELMRRIIAGRPETVVVQEPIVAWPLNEPNVAMLKAYLPTCEKVRRFTIYDHNGEQVQAVHSGCGRTR